MSKLSKNIVDKIKKENVKPKSRTYFIIMHTLLWTAFITSIILGGLATAVVIRHITLTDWQLAKLVRPNPIQRLIVLLPYLWILFIGLIIFIADKLFQHTKRGYRMRPLYVALGSVLISILLGSSFFYFKADQPFEHAIRQNLKPYRQLEEMKFKTFVAPERGVLAGEIKNMQSDELWQSIDFNGQLWAVNVADARISDSLVPALGEKVGMRGKLIEPGYFKAIHVSRWEDARTQMEKRLKEMRQAKVLTPEQLRDIRMLMETRKIEIK